MERSEAPQSHDAPPSVESHHELQHRITALRQVICGLLKTNQELRHALLQAQATTQHEPDPPKPDRP